MAKRVTTEPLSVLNLNKGHHVTDEAGHVHLVTGIKIVRQPDFDHRYRLITVDLDKKVNSHLSVKPGQVLDVVSEDEVKRLGLV